VRLVRKGRFLSWQCRPVSRSGRSGRTSRLVVKESVDSVSSSSEDQDACTKRKSVGPKPSSVIKRPVMNDPRLATVEGKEYSTLLKMMGIDEEDEVTVDAEDEVAVAASSVVSLKFVHDVEGLLEDTKEAFTFFKDVHTRLEKIQVKLEAIMDEEQEMFPGTLSRHILCTDDGSAPTGEQLFQLRRAYYCKSSWVSLHTRLYSAVRMLSESQATVKSCTGTMDYLARVYGKELVVTDQQGWA
jgi:hypothetical protein